jgi:hypothetical protein
MSLRIESANVAIELCRIVGVTLASAYPDLHRRFRDTAILPDYYLLDQNRLLLAGLSQRPKDPDVGWPGEHCSYDQRDQTKNTLTHK